MHLVWIRGARDGGDSGAILYDKRRNNYDVLPTCNGTRKQKPAMNLGKLHSNCALDYHSLHTTYRNNF